MYCTFKHSLNSPLEFSYKKNYFMTRGQNRMETEKDTEIRFLDV